MDFKDTTGYGGRPNPETDANYEKLIDGELVAIEDGPILLTPCQSVSLAYPPKSIKRYFGAPRRIKELLDDL